MLAWEAKAITSWFCCCRDSLVPMPCHCSVAALSLAVIGCHSLAEQQASAHSLLLQVLRVENNRLESLPDTIGELPSLTKLDISTNCLRQLPASMGRLKRIQRIDAANNMLVRVPPAMGHLKTIKELNLR